MSPLAVMSRPRVALEGAECAAIAGRVTSELGVPVQLAVSSRPAAVEDLSPGERRALGTLTTRERATSWLRGRAALKALIGPFGDTDTTRIRFPSPRYSLTHSGDVAVAAACRADLAIGIGVDLEWDRPAPVQAARFFLTAAEAAWASSLGERECAAQLLRLWTIKEALFKADPRNAATVLSDYALRDVREQSGAARAPAGWGQRAQRARGSSREAEAGYNNAAADRWTGSCSATPDIELRYVCARVRGGYLSLAIATRRM